MLKLDITNDAAKFLKKITTKAIQTGDIGNFRFDERSRAPRFNPNEGIRRISAR